MKRLSEAIAKAGEKLKKAGSLSLVAIVVALGVILLLLPTEKDGAESPREPPPEATLSPADTTSLERKMEEALAKIDGAGAVHVILTQSSDGALHLATDRSYSDRGDGGAREQSEETVTVGAGSSTQAPIIIKRDYPDFRGALVVAEGADDATVRLALLEAVVSLTGLGADRVSIARMQIVN